MNDNSNTNLNGGGNNVIVDAPVTYDSYYNHKPRKKPWGIIIASIIVAIIVLVSLWFAGVFTPINRQAEYDKVYKNVCNAALQYSNDNYATYKKVPGKIVYVTINELANANLIGVNLTNYITNEPIPLSTDVRMEVLPNGQFECNGFAWKEDDKIKPVITLRGESIITVSLGSKATDPGAVAIDDKDGDISDLIHRTGNVNTSNHGTYEVNYMVVDRAGNLSDIVTRTYIVQ